MKKEISADTGKKIFPVILMIIGIALAVSLLFMQLNIVAVVAVAFNCIMSAVITLSLIIKKKVYAPMVLAYAASGLGVILYYIIFGADAGFGAFTTGLAGYASEDHPLFTGEGSVFTRLLGNILLASPWILSLTGLFLSAKHSFRRSGIKAAVCAVMCICLLGTSVLYVLTMNMRSKPNTERLWEGHDKYLSGIDKKEFAECTCNYDG